MTLFILNFLTYSPVLSLAVVMVMVVVVTVVYSLLVRVRHRLPGINNGPQHLSLLLGYLLVRILPLLLLDVHLNLFGFVEDSIDYFTIEVLPLMLCHVFLDQGLLDLDFLAVFRSRINLILVSLIWIDEELRSFKKVFGFVNAFLLNFTTKAH